MSHSCSESNHNFSIQDFFVFHQGQDREKLNLNRTWTLMFPKRCPNQFVVPSTSNHPHFPQQGHQTKNGKTSKGWTDSQVHHCSFQFCLPLNSSIFSCRTQLCAIFPLNAFLQTSDLQVVQCTHSLTFHQREKLFLMSSKSVCDNRLALLSLTRTRAQQKKGASNG